MSNTQYKKWVPAVVAAGTWAILSNSVVAAPDLCAAQAVGVPTRPGAPKWFNWSGSDVVDTNIDDPRWLLATGKNFQFTASGGAKSPVETRALWANEGGQNFLYLSFLVNINPMASMSSATAPRDLYLGFRLPAAFDPHTLDAGYGGANENAYIFQFHLDNTLSGGPTVPVAPVRCDDDTVCGETGSAPTNFWRVFVDYNATNNPITACSDVTSGGIVGQKFTALLPDASHPLVGPPAWVNDAVRFWKLDATPSFPLLKNQWAVQIRIPIVDPATTPNANIRQGLVKGSKIWYELTADVGPNRTSVAAWPRSPDLTTHVCQKRSAGAISLVHPDLGNDAKWSIQTNLDYGATPPSDCAGIMLDQSDIGAIFNNPGANFNADPLDTEIKAFAAGNVPAPNELVARVHNNSGTDITGPFIARFRLANWGAQPFWMTGDKGTFADVRGAENGVCASGSAPGCANVTVPANSTSKVAMHFQWQLGSSPADASEYCKFKINPPDAGASCTACNCATDPNRACDATTDTGTKAVVPGSPTAYKCVSARFEHQCLMVEVDAPSAAVDFVNRSNWNNMEFRATSKLTQTATIDVRGLPKSKYQIWQDIYLVVMPRNMPDTVSPTTSVDLIRSKVDDLAVKLARPYLEDLNNQQESKLFAARSQLKHGAITYNRYAVGAFGGDCYGASGSGSGSGSGCGGGQREPNDAELALIRASEIMPDDDFRKAQNLLDIALTPDGPGQAEMLTHKAVNLLGPNSAADVVPTLDIYAFYRVDPAGVTKGALYLPMTSFSVFLFHDATTINGMRWAIDGFQKVGDNIYREVLPVDQVRQIQIRAQSLEDGEPPIPPGDPEWGEGCSAAGGIGAVTPAFVAIGLLIARRRRKRAAN